MIALFRLVMALALLAAATPAVAAQDDGEAVDLRVMTFNVWLGGGQVDFGKVVEAIRAAEADVVGLQEVEGNAGRIAQALGWSYVDPRLQVISRYPLIDPPGGDGIYTFVQIRPGRVVAVANVHLPSDPYGPEAVRDGGDAAEVLALERETRLPAIDAHLAALPLLAAAGIPVFLTGDFNAPSHLDWTPAASAARPAVRYPLAWPVGQALAEAGFRDSYREAHPDPVATPGLTWTPGYPHPTVRPEETFDRIDWVLVAGEATVESRLVGEADGADVEVAVDPWPSDHRGVVSAFRVTPGEPPPLVAVERRVVAAGEPLLVRYHARGEEGERIAILPAAGDAAALMAMPPIESAVDGSVTFGTGLLPPGAYAAALLGAGGEEVARIPFWVQAVGARPELTVEAAYAADEPIVVGYANAPGYRWDWLGVYAAGDPDLGNYLAYVYTGAGIEGSATFVPADFGEPLPPGDYEVRLLRDDGYVLLATAPFSVTE